MTVRREITKRESEHGLELEISELRSRGELAGDASRTGALYGGIAGASGLVLTVLYAMTFMPKYGLMRGLRNFAEAMSTALPAVGAYGLPLLLGLFAVVSVGAAWKRRSFANSYRITSDGERLRCLQQTPSGERTLLDVSAENVLDVQANRSNRSDADAIAEDPWELSVVTEDDVRTFGAGLEERACRRAADAIEETLAETRADADAEDEVLLDFDDSDSASADSRREDADGAAAEQPSRREQTVED